jgi:hypothetical protein
MTYTAYGAEDMTVVGLPHICDAKQGSSKRVPAQTVDATPLNQLIRQGFSLESSSSGLCLFRPSQGSVFPELTLTNEFRFDNRC